MRVSNHDNRLILITEFGPDDVPLAGVDVEQASEGRFASDPQAVYDQWGDFVAWAGGADLSGSAPKVDVAPHLLGPPAPRPRQVFAIALNYVAHAEEAKMAPPTTPPTFTKYPTSLTGPFCEVELPSGNVDWEVELVAVIGARAEHVEEADAWSYVAGLTIGQDLSERKVQMLGPAPQFSLAKSFPGFGPMGPALVTADELGNRDDLSLTTHIGSELMQDGRTSQMIFGVSALVHRLSDVLPLLPGDVIFTGTPSGVGMARTPPRFLAPGETLITTIEGLGQMRHTLRAGRPFAS